MYSPETSNLRETTPYRPDIYTFRCLSSVEYRRGGSDASRQCPMTFTVGQARHFFCPRKGPAPHQCRLASCRAIVRCKSGQSNSGGTGRRKGRARRPGARHTILRLSCLSQDVRSSQDRSKTTEIPSIDVATADAGLFEVQKINPPPQSLGIHSLPVDTHNGDQITVEDEVSRTIIYTPV